MSSKMSALQLMSTARNIIRNKTPYLEAGIYTLSLHEAPGLNTMGVTNNGVLMVDYEWLATQSIQEVAGCLVHEVMHIIRDTHGRARPLVGFDAASIPYSEFTEEQHHLMKRANFAADLAINTDVRDAGYALPQGALFPAAFGFPEHLTMEAYYRLLEEQEQKNGGKGKGKGQGQGECSSGHCGSGGGHAQPGEPGGQSKAARTQTELDQMRRAVADAVKREVAKGKGTVPGGLSVWAGEITKPPKVPWRRLLARAMRQGIEWAEGAVDLRFDGPSRRQAALGYGQGVPILPRLRAPVPDVMVGVDTSGSMLGHGGYLEQVMPEVIGVVRSTETSVEFVAIDAAIESRKRVSRWQELIPLLKGGGGTVFTPLFDMLAGLQKRPGVLVLMTDGDAWGIPTEEPFPDIDWIWVVPKGRKAPVSWGKEIIVDDD